MQSKEKEDNYDAEEDFTIFKNAVNQLGRGRKRTTDSREFSQLLNLFRILEPLKTKPLPVIRSFIKDVGKHLFHEGEHLDTNTLAHPLECIWLVTQGKVELISHSSETSNQQSATLSEGDCFSSHNCHYKQYLDQPQHFVQFSIKAKTSQNVKLNKIFQIDEVEEQLQKRALICRALNLHTSGHTIKAFVKRFVLRKFNKSTILVQQGHREEMFFVISKGDIELTKNCTNENGEKVKIRIGIVTQDSFINDYSFFKQAQVCPSEYTLESMTELQVYSIPKAELFKYFYDLPTLWPNISFICDQKHTLRQKFITKHLQRRQLIQSQQPSSTIVYPLFKKGTLGFRKQIPTGNQDFIMQTIKYEQLVVSKEKVVKPLMEKEIHSRGKRSYQLQSGELKKIMKKEKMDIMKVKSLVDNRIRGIRSDDVNIKLKPTLFNDGVRHSQIQQQIQTSTTNTPVLLSSRVNVKVKNRKMNMSLRNFGSENIRHTTCDKPITHTSQVQVRDSKKFRTVVPRRQHYESFINRSSDPYIFTRCQTGKARKIRAIL